MQNTQDIQKSIINSQDELLRVMKYQLIDLSLMSKIELGDDVILEINRLQEEISQLKIKLWDAQASNS
jgi:hypothetical protein